MCFETEFALLLNAEQTVPKDPKDITTARFQFQYGDLEPFGSSTSSHLQNMELRLLQKQLEELVPYDKRMLLLEFKVNSQRTDNSDREWIRSVDVFLEGEILTGIHSILGCDRRSEDLGLKLKGRLFGVSEGSSDTRVLSTDSGDGYIQLESLPHHPSNCDHGRYGYLKPWRMNLNKNSVTFGNRLTSWKVSNLNVVIKRANCSCGTIASQETTQVFRKLLDGGAGTDVEIVSKGGVSTPCHGTILMAHSPVIEKMLTEGHFVEGTTKRIEMLERTPEEVKAFLQFLYFGATEIAVKDASVNVSLFEMGDYYGIQSLKEKSKEIFLKFPLSRVPVNAALRMADVAELLDGPDLNKKALDALAIRPEEEIVGSELFEEIFPTASGKKLFLRMIARIRL